MLNNIKKIRTCLLILTVLNLLNVFIFYPAAAKNTENTIDKKLILTNLDNINITNDLTKDKKLLEKTIKEKRPKSIYLEQWITLEPNRKDILKTLNKIAKKYNAKFFLVIGKNTWFGNRGISNTLAAYDMYGEYVDGIVLRLEPNKVNVWKDDASIKAQILNQMLDAYAAIYNKAKKRNKAFVVEFPFWFSDFEGPLRSFSQDACLYSDKIIFLIDNLKKLNDLKTKWNDIPCLYQINLTKRATNQTEDSIEVIYKKLYEDLTFYQNFNGFIVDSDNNIKEIEPNSNTNPK